MREGPRMAIALAIGAGTILGGGHALFSKIQRDICSALARGEAVDTRHHLSIFPNETSVDSVIRACNERGIEGTRACFARGLRETAQTTVSVTDALVKDAKKVEEHCHDDE